MPNQRKVLANALRALSMDAVEKANSGHPGAPMGLADLSEVLWNDFLHHNPKNPQWANRDRFVLSNGHASMLLYSLLHLSGYDLPLKELENFRQLHSKTPGHPENGLTPGVETTTGPLGQGLANAVGMALAERHLAAQFNRDGFPVVDHFTYAIVGDGCLMEGISHEACSLAGNLGLGKLIVIYDSNGISIDGKVEGWFSDDTQKRFESYGWQVIPHVDGHNSEAVRLALEDARSTQDRPTLIECRTVIGFGSPKKAGSQHSHGAPLGKDEIVATRAALGWSHAPFEIPEEVRKAWDARERGAKLEATWSELFSAYEKKHPELAKEFRRRQERRLPQDWSAKIAATIAEAGKDPKAIATRQASKNVLNQIVPALPELLGGSADLTDSNLTRAGSATTLSKENFGGNYVFFGVREFGMSAIGNGLALHGGVMPFSGTFLMFMEYARNAVRMASLMRLQNIFVYTHDSIGLGEDGPTHQAVEQVANLRLTPNLSTWRPCDAVETAVAWKAAVERKDGPTALVLSRQAVTLQERNAAQVSAIEKGGYTIFENSANPDCLLIATGSEVELAVAAGKELASAGMNVRVVSMPSTDRFLEQPKDYQESVLPSRVRARVAVEAGIADYWYRFTGLDGKVIGMRSFGESAPAKDLYKHFGITVDAVTRAAKDLLKL